MSYWVDAAMIRCDAGEWCERMKAELRSECLHLRSKMSTDEWREKSDSILLRLTKSEEYAQAKRIFTFVSIGKEVDTKSLIKCAWADGKEVYVPIAKKQTGMYFVRLHNFDELRERAFGVWEPAAEKAEEVIPADMDLFLVPGLVFDGNGNRYGYGGGYYDRYFAEHQSVFKIAVAFSFQVMDTVLKTAGFDVAVDWIVTENGWIGGEGKCW